MKRGDLLWIRARVFAVTPNAIVVTVEGPKGTEPQVNIDPSAPTIPAHRTPTPEEPTASL